MNFLELAKARYSVRSFKDIPIEPEKLDMIIEAGRVAPSACNKQPQKIYVVNNKQNLQKLASVCRFTFSAPTVIVVAYDNDRDWKNKLMSGYGSGETDAAIVGTHMMLAAWDVGVASCWVGYFNANDIRTALDLPENIRVCALLPMGYPADDASPAALHSEYREFDDTVRFM